MSTKRPNGLEAMKNILYRLVESMNATRERKDELLRRIETSGSMDILTHSVRDALAFTDVIEPYSEDADSDATRMLEMPFKTNEEME